MVFVLIFFNKTAASLKSSTFVTDPVQSSPLSFNKRHKAWLDQSGHCLVAFLIVEFKNSKRRGDKSMRGLPEFVYRYLKSQVLDAEE